MSYKTKLYHDLECKKNLLNEGGSQVDEECWYIKGEKLEDGPDQEGLYYDYESIPKRKQPHQPLNLYHEKQAKMDGKEYKSEEGDDDDEKKAKVKPEFLRKVFGLFTTQVLLLSAYVVTLVSFKEKSKYETLTDFGSSYQSWTMFMICCVVFLVSLTVLLTQKKIQQDKRFNFLLLFIYTSSISYMAGVLVILTPSAYVLAALGSMVVISIGMLTCATTIVKLFKLDVTFVSFGKAFTMLGTVVVTAMFLAYACFGDSLKEGKMTRLFFVALGALVLFFYFLFDAWAIVEGKYDPVISDQDYCYASAKLFADFTFGFIFIMWACVAGDK